MKEKLYDVLTYLMILAIMALLVIGGYMLGKDTQARQAREYREQNGIALYYITEVEEWGRTQYEKGFAEGKKKQRLIPYIMYQGDMIKMF